MLQVNHRLKSLVATALIQILLAYALIAGLAMTIAPKAGGRLAAVALPKQAPKQSSITPPRAAQPLGIPASVPGAPVILQDWALAGPEQRNLDFIKARKWVQDNLTSDEDKRLARWRAELPRGSGPARVTRLQPSNLPTHTLYWPGEWKGLLPIIAWGNGAHGQCTNSSLPYAAFLSEIASHGYFVVAVGNDDIEYPQPEGMEFLADGRPIHSQASALRKAIDWAIEENGRAGSPYAGRLDTGRIAYMGHDCGGRQALEASSDPRATTIVLLNTAASFKPDPSGAHQAPIAHFEGLQDEADVIAAGEANFAMAQSAGWPMFKAALGGIGHEGAYPGPDRRWSRAVLAWLDWQLKGDSKEMASLGGLSRHGWSRVRATGISITAAP